MTKQLKGFGAVIGMIIVIVLGIGAAVGYYFYEKNTEAEIVNQNNNVVAKTNINQNTNAADDLNTNQAVVDTADWQTYTNTDYQYSLHYPSNFYRKDIGPTDKYTHFSSKDVDAVLDMGEDGIWVTFRVDLNTSNTSLADFAATMPFNTTAVASQVSQLTVNSVQAIQQLEDLQEYEDTPGGYAWVTYLASEDMFYSIRAVALNRSTLDGFKAQYDAMADSFWLIE